MGMAVVRYKQAQLARFEMLEDEVLTPAAKIVGCVRSARRKLDSANADMAEVEGLMAALRRAAMLKAGYPWAR